ncbi:hypothetical protein [Streptomyces sp. NPDC051993]
MAIPAMPVIVIALPEQARWETFTLSVITAASAAMGRLAWKFFLRQVWTA